eukprot:m.58669 g.58669  ORF g.58669 m.58669 type:complete len:292 (-) comp22595_c0_seq2:20-895(-)
MEALVISQEKEELELNEKLLKLKRRLGKDKKKNKSINSDIARLESELTYLKDAHETQRLELEGSNDHEVANEVLDDKDETTKPITDLITPKEENNEEEDPTTPKISKAQKRREKKEQERKEAEKRISEAEVEDSATKKHMEYAQLNAVLTPLKLTTSSIKPDGHCMFKALSVQLPQTNEFTVEALRTLSCDFMRNHPDDFKPFLTTDKGDLLTNDEFDKYCNTMEKSAAWGGECELVALSKALHRAIKVFQASGSARVFGDDGGDSTSALLLSYHLHEFSLGAHYNAVVSL